MKMYFLASAHFKWSVDSSCDVVPVEVHTSVFIKSILLSITQGPHAWNLQHVRSKNKYIIHFQSYVPCYFVGEDYFWLWKNKQKYIHRKISLSIIFIFLDTNFAPGCTMAENNRRISSMSVHGSKGVQAFCTFCIYLYMARMCNWQKRWLIVRTAIWFKTLKSD